VGALTRLAAVSALLLATPAAAQSVERWSGYIAEASARFGLPEPWIRRVMAAESGGRTVFRGRPITSPAGAMGLMQLMPGTWRDMRRAHGLGADPHNPRDNILAGAAYLRAMYERFGYPGLFAAYNAGPRRYGGHIVTGRTLPAETLAYVDAVSGLMVRPNGGRAANGPPARPPSLFAPLSPREEPGPGASVRSPMGGGSASLFVPLSGSRPAPDPR